MPALTIEFHPDQTHRISSDGETAGVLQITSSGYILTKLQDSQADPGFLKTRSLYYTFIRLFCAIEALDHGEPVQFPISEVHFFEFIPRGNAAVFRILTRQKDAAPPLHTGEFCQQAPEGSMLDLATLRQEIVTAGQKYSHFFRTNIREEHYFLADDFDAFLATTEQQISLSLPESRPPSASRECGGTGEKAWISLSFNPSPGTGRNGFFGWDSRLFFSSDSGNISLTIAPQLEYQTYPRHGATGFFLDLTNASRMVLHNRQLRMHLADSYGLELTPSGEYTSVRWLTKKTYCLIDTAGTDENEHHFGKIQLHNRDLVADLIRCSEKYYYTFAAIYERPALCWSLRTNIHHLMMALEMYEKTFQQRSPQPVNQNGFFIEFSPYCLEGSLDSGYSSGSYRVVKDGIILTKKADDDFDDGFVVDADPKEIFEQMIGGAMALLEGRGFSIQWYEQDALFSDFCLKDDVVWYRFTNDNPAHEAWIDEKITRYPNYSSGTPVPVNEMIEQLIRVCEEYVRQVRYTARTLNIPLYWKSVRLGNHIDRMEKEIIRAQKRFDRYQRKKTGASARAEPLPDITLLLQPPPDFSEP